MNTWGFPGGSVVKILPASAGDARDMGLIPEFGKAPGGGNGNPVQYSCQSKIRLSMHTYINSLEAHCVI